MARGEAPVCELGHPLEPDRVTHLRAKDAWEHARPVEELSERDWELAERRLGRRLPRPAARLPRVRARRRRR